MFSRPCGEGCAKCYRVMCLGGYEGFDEFKNVLFDESCALHGQKFHDLNQRLWEKAILDDSQSSRHMINIIRLMSLPRTTYRTRSL